MEYEVIISNPQLSNTGYVIAVADLKDKHDRSTPSDYHWKILKCRMLLFSNSSILACPDKQEVKKVHIVFNKVGDDYDKLNSLFLKFSLTQDGGIRQTTQDLYEMCFNYTMNAKLAPSWNTIGIEYLINNRNFLLTKGPQKRVKIHVRSSDLLTVIKVKPMKINLIRSDNDLTPGTYVRVLPSLNKAVLEERYSVLPKTGLFKNYKDLRRHWKNIHGYRLPEEDGTSYCAVKFWRGEPFTYPEICILRNFPIITPMPKHEEREVVKSFLSCLKNKMTHILGSPIVIETKYSLKQVQNETLLETQVISLCTPTQNNFHDTTTDVKSRKPPRNYY